MVLGITLRFQGHRTGEGARTAGARALSTVSSPRNGEDILQPFIKDLSSGMFLELVVFQHWDYPRSFEKTARYPEPVPQRFCKDFAHPA